MLEKNLHLLVLTRKQTWQTNVPLERLAYEYKLVEVMYTMERQTARMSEGKQETKA